MADITMCKGISGTRECPVKHMCYRHTAKEDELQSYFIDIPFNGTTCDYYWGDNKANVFNPPILITDESDVDEVNDMDDDVDGMEFKLNQD